MALRLVSPNDFSLLRMKKDTSAALVEVIRPLYPVKLIRGDAPVVDVDRAVLMTLRYIGHEVAMDDVGDMFGVALSSVHKEVHGIVSILCTLSNKFIVWPNENDCTHIQQQFMARAGIPGRPKHCMAVLLLCTVLFIETTSVFKRYAEIAGVVGAIDGCHIEVLAPADDQESYTDRKMNHSIILQGTECKNASMLFMVCVY